MEIIQKKQGSQKETIEELLIRDLTSLEKYIRAFWRFLPIAVCYINPAFKILDISKNFENLFGFTSLEIIGQHLGKIFQESKEIEEMEKVLLKKEVIFKKETTLLTKQGRKFPVNLSVMPREDEEGTLYGYFLAFLDITESKRLEKELKDKIVDLEKFQELVVGRELKMIELKKRIRELESKK